jgi:hypothetical protein
VGLRGAGAAAAGAVVADRAAQVDRAADGVTAGEGAGIGRSVHKMRSAHIGALISGLIAVSLLGCTPTVAPDWVPAISITTVQDTVSFIRAPAATWFDINVTIKNTGTDILRIESCGPDAQRDIAGSWTTVSSLICAAVLSSGGMAPGASATYSVRIFGATAPNMEPKLDPNMTAGRYRLIYRIGRLADQKSFDPSASADAVSNQFTVKD